MSLLFPMQPKVLQLLCQGPASHPHQTQMPAELEKQSDGVRVAPGHFVSRETAQFPTLWLQTVVCVPVGEPPACGDICHLPGQERSIGVSGPTAPVCRGTRGFGDPARPQFADAVSTGNWAVCIRKKHGGMCPSC